MIYSLIVGGVVYKEIKPEHFKDIMNENITATAGTMFLVSTASLFGWLLAYEHVPEMIGQWMQEISSNPIVPLLVAMVMSFKSLMCLTEGGVPENECFTTIQSEAKN